MQRTKWPLTDQMHPFYLAVVVLSAAVALFCVIALLSWASRQWWTGRLVMDASRPRSRAMMIGFFVLLVCWIALLWTDSARHFFSFDSVVLLTLATTTFINRGLEIREGGIFYEWRFISWKRIKTWSWENTGGRPLATWSEGLKPEAARLRVELLRPLFFRNSVTLTVPTAQVAAISGILNARAELVNKDF